MLPNLIIIGAAKCGTTSLHYYLNLHPEIRMSNEKELHFFVNEFNWKKGIRWYSSRFSGKAKIYGETSPIYTAYPFFKGVPERMRSLIPNAKLIYILRDPVRRIISHYNHYYSERREHRNINEALRNFDTPYVQRSRYHMQLEQYLKYFPQKNIFILDLEDLNHFRLRTLQEIFRFLKVEDTFDSKEFSRALELTSDKKRLSRAGYFLKTAVQASGLAKLPMRIRNKGKFIYSLLSRPLELPVLDPALKQGLIDYLQDDVHCLRKLTGKKFETWCV